MTPIWANLPEYQKWAGVISANGRAYGLPAGLLEALLYRESTYRPDVINGTRRSSAGAAGIAQFTAATAQALGVDRFNPASSINGAARYLAQLYRQFGSWPLALAAYNWGPGNVRKLQRGIVKAVPRETSNYVAALTGQALPVYA